MGGNLKNKKALLHRQVEQVKINKWNRMLIHALIELELVIALECAYHACQFDSREFDFSGSTHRHPRGLTIDHKISRAAGGSDLPQNLQLLHFACNSIKAGSEDITPARRERQAEASRRRWKTDRDTMLATFSKAARTPEALAKRSDSMRAYHADPANAEKRKATIEKAAQTRRMRAAR